MQIVENTLHELWFDHIEEVDDSDPRAPSRTVTLATAAGRQRKRRFRAADAAEITANQL